MSERGCSHFSHYIASVHLNRNLTDPEFSADLLVRQSRHHQCHHFTFARSERSITGSHLVQFTFAPENGFAALNCVPYSAQERFVIDGLSQKVYSTTLHCPYRRFDIPVTGQKYDWGREAFRNDLPLKSKP